MTMLTPTSMPARSGLAGLYSQALQFASSVPLSAVQFVARLAVANVFWQSSQSKLASWPVTVQLFAFEYRVPVLDPGIAAVLATAAEFSGAILLFFGLFSRLAALMLLGVVATIQIFVYPGHWGEHLTWAVPLLLIFARGAGVISIDHLAVRFFSRER
ncbi:DoxX family protein [Rhizobium mongolense]|uniref:Putative oxidoreductase n=1 Tax=Rhizobium mongolense TaxID=57676 RepID=A0A7W6RI81_9HYPH|nr:DoxX family protein [Rhizobium mongolense]MBB4272859.1 putative oxidoreductase [Rhizobium mongolense]